MEGSARHGYGDVYAARTYCNLADAASGGGVAVAAQKRGAGLAEPLQMQLVADPVAGLRVDNAVTLGYGGEEIVVVGVFEADLHGIVVYIGYGEVVLDVVHTHGFKLQVGHCARGVLRQGLVNADSDFGIL